MITQEIEYLRGLYLKNFYRIVDYGNGPRTVVRRPKNWARLPSKISTSESIIMTPENINKTFVWSDLHFFHKNIIKFSNRPYINIQQMNETLIANHNDCVTDEDICIWVGDVGFGNDAQINELLDQCNGYKILIIGNHDFNKRKIRKLNFDEIHLIYQITVPEVSMVFTHYPMHNIKLPWFNIHGHLHVHPKLETGNILHFNANCEAHMFRPITLTKIIKIAKLRVIAAGI